LTGQAPADRRPLSVLLASALAAPASGGNGEWRPVRLQRDANLSFYYCSAYGFHTGNGLVENGDIAHVGC
jgi:hypothetical protein